MATGQSSTLSAADEAARPLRGVLEDAWLTLDAQPAGDGRWLEVYRGAPADPVFVCIDVMGNVLHVQFRDATTLTLSYLPGWCYEAATAAHADRRPDPPEILVADLDSAQPLVFELTVENPIDGAYRSVTVAGEAVAYRPLPFGYAFTPARGYLIEEARAGSTPLVHWSALRLRLAAAPGVAYSARPLLSTAALTTLRAAYVIGDGPTTCDQALSFEFERHRHPGTVPPLGEPLRTVPAAEADLVAGAVAMRAAASAGPDAGGGEPDVEGFAGFGLGGGPLATATHQVRADGIDLLLVKPDQRSAPRAQPWSWQPAWFVTAATVLDDALFALAKDMYDSYVQWLGGLPDTTPLPIRIRVDPASAEDRFAYRLDHLDADGKPTDRPVPAEQGRAAFRLSVVHTPGVEVFLDLAVGNAAAEGPDAISGIVEYRAREVKYFDDVPLEITEETLVPEAVLPDRPATLAEIVHVIHTLGQFVPIPIVQNMYDLEDLGSVAAYVLTGRNLYGEPMTGLEAALTLGGVLLPEIAERAGGTLLTAARRVLTLGDTPLYRLRAAAAAVQPVDARVAEAFVHTLSEAAR
ncbi:hypothetical protein [Micromonospora saelicesensis]|uniref:hypothetical protein n=1 Tax=Micromonospora saelicesensis TaxID=285676 RepID=UPI0011BD5379|nr:hypothetical protein [Micromonospora saelicesensis]